MKHVLWTPHVTIYFIWILLAFHLTYKTPQVLKLNLFLILRNLWKVTIFHQQMFSLYNMTMTWSYSIKRLIVHRTISTIRTLCEKQGQDKFLIHDTDRTHNFALSQFMPQHNCEELRPIDTPSTASTLAQTSSDHTSNQICAHNPMTTQCNQSQYHNLLKEICALNPSASEISQTYLSNSLTSKYPPDPGSMF